MSISAKLADYDETRELLDRLKVRELKKLAGKNDVSLEREYGSGKIRHVRAKAEIIDVLVENEFRESDLVELLGVSRLTKEELLNQMKVTQLKKLAKETGVVLKKETLSGTRKATKKSDIIEVLDVLSTSKVRYYAKKIGLIKKLKRKQAKGKVGKTSGKKRKRSGRKAKKRKRPAKKLGEKETSQRSKRLTKSGKGKRQATEIEDLGKVVVRVPTEYTTERKARIVEEVIRERLIEREIIRRNTLGIRDEDVLRLLRYTKLDSVKRKGKYETQLSRRLSREGYPIEREGMGEPGGFNLVMGEDDNIAVEVKTVRDVNVFNNLLGKIYRNKDRFGKVFAVLIDELGDRKAIRKEAKRIEEIDPEKIKVIVKKSKRN